MPTDPDDKLDLRTLAPQYNEVHHGIYVRALEAIEDSTMKKCGSHGCLRHGQEQRVIASTGLDYSLWAGGGVSKSGSPVVTVDTVRGSRRRCLLQSPDRERL